MKREVIVGLALIALVVAGLGYMALSDPAAGTTASQPTMVATAPPAAREVVAQAKVVPRASVELSFPTAGTVAEVLVQEGQPVVRGQPIARLETRALELAIADAEAALAEAQASEQLLRAGATAEELAIADAQLREAEGQYTQTNGAVTAADHTAAQRRVEEAQATLARLEQGAKPTDLSAARAALEQARATAAQMAAQLQATRDRTSNAKTSAEAALQQATIELERAQSDYSVAYWANQSLRNNGNIPASVSGMPDQSVTDYGELQQSEEFKQATLRLREAEQAVAQAQVALDYARQAERTEIAQAEQQQRQSDASVVSAQAALDDLLDGADRDDLAAARANLAQARADLERLAGMSRAGTLESARAVVDQAAARREALSAPPRAADLANAQAQVKRAEVALEQARYARDQATLSSPIAGTLAELNLKPGEPAPTERAAAVVADLADWQIETDDLTELDIVAVRPGAAVTITFDAIPGLSLPGTVQRIKPIGATRQGDITYTVVIVPSQFDQRLYWNMTASVSIKEAP